MTLFATLRKEILKDHLRKSEVGNQVLSLEEKRDNLVNNNPVEHARLFGALLWITLMLITGKMLGASHYQHEGVGFMVNIVKVVMVSSIIWLPMVLQNRFRKNALSSELNASLNRQIDTLLGNHPEEREMVDEMRATRSA